MSQSARTRVVAAAFLSLRAASALGGVANGFALTYGFARILEPRLFALFMFVGNLGVALWFFDLGLARVLYVRLREMHLAHALRSHRDLQLQANAVVLLYLLLVACGTPAAFVLGERFGKGAPLALFFVFCALNLPWYALRQISAAVDRFVAFEAHETLRRVTHIGLIVALPFGLPLNAALIAGDLAWAALFISSLRLLMRVDVVAFGSPAASARALWTFLSRNVHNVLWSAGFVGSEFYSYSYPPLLIPLVYGLGPTAIAFDTAYKVFRGTNVILAAACEVAVPWQTRAHIERNRLAMVRATVAAALLSLLPAAGVCVLLVFAGDTLFARLLGAVATVPYGLSLLIAVLVMANWLQTVANFTLAYNGFFSAMARLALLMAALLSVAGLYNILMRPGLVGFTTWYAVIYVAGAVAYFLLALRLPLQVRVPAMVVAARSVDAG